MWFLFHILQSFGFLFPAKTSKPVLAYLNAASLELFANLCLTAPHLKSRQEAGALPLLVLLLFHAAVSWHAWSSLTVNQLMLLRNCLWRFLRPRVDLSSPSEGSSTEGQLPPRSRATCLCISGLKGCEGWSAWHLFFFIAAWMRLRAPI